VSEGSREVILRARVQGRVAADEGREGRRTRRTKDEGREGRRTRRTKDAEIAHRARTDSFTIQ
jgi:hypothetical protein